MIEKNQGKDDSKQYIADILNQAHTRTWLVVEIALAWNFYTNQWLMNEIAQKVLAPLQDWLKEQSDDFKYACLTELQVAKISGFLAPINSDNKVLEILDSNTMPTDAKALITALTSNLAPHYPNIFKFVTTPEPEFLPKALTYFLRLAIIEQPVLLKLFAFTQTTSIYQDQALEFAALTQLFNTYGDSLEATLNCTPIPDQPQSPSQTQINNQLQYQDVVAKILRQIHERLPTKARRGGVATYLSAALRMPADTQLLTDLEQQLTTLPKIAYTPKLLDALGRLSLAIGAFSKAQAYFQQTAILAHHADMPSIDAEANYNVYKTLLEQRNWDAALWKLLIAAQLKPDEFMPFPIHKYQPQRIISASGLGVTFQCNHIQINKTVIVKILYQEELDRNITEIFQEAEILRKIRHPGIINILSCEYMPGEPKRPYLVMEYFPELSLFKHLRRDYGLAINQATLLAKLLADTLYAAHQQGVFHLNLNPSNILIRLDQGKLRFKLINFGLVVAGHRMHMAVTTGLVNRSLLGQSLGENIHCSPPEQMNITAGNVGPWSDIYSFGKTLCYALFRNPTPTQEQWKFIGADNPLAQILIRCTHNEPAKRFQDFKEILNLLNEIDSVNVTEYFKDNVSSVWGFLGQDVFSVFKTDTSSSTFTKPNAIESKTKDKRKSPELVNSEELKTIQEKIITEETRLARLIAQRETEEKRLIQLQRQLEEVEHCLEEYQQQIEAQEITPIHPNSQASIETKSIIQAKHALKAQIIHGWNATRVQALQNDVATALKQKVSFNDPIFSVAIKQKVEKGGLLHGLLKLKEDCMELQLPISPPKLVLIPPGRFLMGSPKAEPGHYDNEEQHEVTIERAFGMGQYAVTFDEYNVFCIATNRRKPYTEGWSYEQHPVINVNWEDAKAYCQWLSQNTGKEYRLPTEAEWEYACRAGSSGPFNFGEPITTDKANYDGNFTYSAGPKGELRGKTVPVNTFEPNAWGLYQMHGNVWEWCEDCWHNNYYGAPTDSSAWIIGGECNSRVMRGGSWGNYPRALRSANRGRHMADGSGNYRGFRIVREI